MFNKCLQNNWVATWEKYEVGSLPHNSQQNKFQMSYIQYDTSELEEGTRKLEKHLRMGRSFQNMAETPEAIRENVDQFDYKEIFLSLSNKNQEGEKI